MRSAASTRFLKVYRVYDPRCSRQVAMAVIKGDAAEGKAQFLRAARLTALLQHPNIMSVYETGVNEQDAPYFTMKLMKGDTLAGLIETREPQGAAGRKGRRPGRLCQNGR